MSGIKRYGDTPEELDADSIFKCRKIVRTIVEFGVTEQQKLKLIQLLALELEDRDQLQQISDLIDRLAAGEKRSTLVTDVS